MSSIFFFFFLFTGHSLVESDTNTFTSTSRRLKSPLAVTWFTLSGLRPRTSKGLTTEKRSAAVSNGDVLDAQIHLWCSSSLMDKAAGAGKWKDVVYHDNSEKVQMTMGAFRERRTIIGVVVVSSGIKMEVLVASSVESGKLQI